MRKSIVATVAIVLVGINAYADKPAVQAQAAPMAKFDPSSNCMNCSSCSFMGHYDWIDIQGPEYNYWTGGTFHNICNTTASACFDSHSLCPPMGAGAMRMNSKSLNTIETALSGQSTPELKSVLQRYKAWVSIDQDGGAILVRNCRNETIAKFLVPQHHFLNAE
jgi:hypothetical protein